MEAYYHSLEIIIRMRLDGEHVSIPDVILMAHDAGLRPEVLCVMVFGYLPESIPQQVDHEDREMITALNIGALGAGETRILEAI